MTTTKKRKWGTLTMRTGHGPDDRYYELAPHDWVPRVKVQVDGVASWRKRPPSVEIDWSCMGVDIPHAETFAKMLAEAIKIAKSEAKRLAAKETPNV